METSQKINLFIEFFEKNYLEQILCSFQKGGQCIVVDFNTLAKFNHELAEDILDEPEEMLKSAEIAIEHFDIPESIGKFRVRFDNLPKSNQLDISTIRTKHLNKFWTISGLLKQKTKVLPEATSARFECPSCGQTINVLQLEKKMREPTRCSCGRKGKFKLLGKEQCDTQLMLVEESPDELEGNKQPQSLDIILRYDLTNVENNKRMNPGCKIVVSGIVKEIPISLKDGGISTRSEIIMEVNYIKTLDDDVFQLNITEEEKKKIYDFSKNKNLFVELKRYVGVSVYGLDDMKEAILLQAVEGKTKFMEDGSKRRGLIHLLATGDPGTGKSVLTRSILNLVPRSRFVSGKGASGVGLTAAVVKNRLTNESALEAGALVLANGSICIIDEMDKADEEDIASLHTAMEQGIVPIDKAGIHATLKADTSVFAISNPSSGRFDPYEPLGRQIKFLSSLLNRFDLMFIIRDVPDAVEDEKAADFILDLHEKGRTESKLTKQDYDFFRKYVLFAKQIEPTLSVESREIIKKFYSLMRSQSGKESASIAISKRQLEGLVRLTEASAKLRLSSTTNKEDAERAVRLMLGFLKEFGYDSKTNTWDIDRAQSVTPASERTKIHQVRDIIRRLARDFVDNVPFEAIIEEAKKDNITEDDVDEIIELLKKNGDIIEPRSGLYKEV